jgi:hypothetical protein
MADKNSQVAKPDPFQAGRLYSPVRFHHFLRAGFPEIQHPMFREEGQDREGDRRVNR